MALTWDKTIFDELYSGNGWPYGVRGVDWGAGDRIPRFHYNWFTQKTRLQSTVENLQALPGFSQLSHIAIIGGGFGWLGEILTSQGINVAVIDTSSYIINNVGVSEEADLRGYITAMGMDPDNLPMTFMSPDDPNAELPAGAVWNYWLHPSGTRSTLPIMDEDLANPASRNRVKSALSNNMDSIITEHVLDSMTTDAEALAVVEQAEQLRPNPAVAVIHLVDANTTGDPRLLNKTLTDWGTLLTTNGFGNHYITTPAGVYQRADGAA